MVCAVAVSATCRMARATAAMLGYPHGKWPSYAHEVHICRTTGKPFLVSYWQKDYMILPAKYLPDIRGAGRDHLAFVDSISDILFLYNWVGDLFKSSRMVFAGKPIFCLYGLRGWFSRAPTSRAECRLRSIKIYGQLVRRSSQRRGRMA